MIPDLLGVVGFGFLSALFLWLGFHWGFFRHPSPGSEEWRFPIRWYHVVMVFGIYFATVIAIVPWLSLIFQKKISSSSPIAAASWLNFTISSTIACALAIYMFCIPRSVAQGCWRDPKKVSYLEDFRFAASAWLISFPLVIFMNQLIDFLIHIVFQISALPDQLAVRFLKMTFQDPLQFFLTVFTIVILAPLIEETLFRGFLQSFIRQHLGSKRAILITALCFSFFHYSPEQGLANISIIGSLFSLALFLGFVYDRRRSLAASIALHGYFNAINVLNLYFLGGFPKGPI